jgi:23S rRNA (uracil1939-C5)-methyltransferase
MLTAGLEIELLVEKPAAGGRMIARHGGQVVFVAGAIPGERVKARVERVERQLAFATATGLIEASADRREPFSDPLCGGCLYSHIAYDRQLQIKAAVVEDAFTRLGRLPVPVPVMVKRSPERGYRMRARLRAAGDRIGFYREGSHVLCDARATHQMIEAGLDAAATAVSMLHGRGARVAVVEIAENLIGDGRVLRIEVANDLEAPGEAVTGLAAIAGVSGVALVTPQGSFEAGVPLVQDDLASLSAGRATAGRLVRRPTSFFQANRFLLPELVIAVLDAVPASGDVLDLYAGVGLFALSLAATGRTRVTAVEGDRSSGADLFSNASQFAEAVRVVASSVEEYLARRLPQPATVIVDPPRTGMSRPALDRIASLKPQRVVYVSCDPPTMARDARRLVDAGYRLTSLRAFDLFPNTPHVESLGIFDA